jgi:hypothetical protein
MPRVTRSLKGGYRVATPTREGRAKDAYAVFASRQKVMNGGLRPVARKR